MTVVSDKKGSRKMKARSGSLERRNSGYYCRIMIEGKRIAKPLYNADGSPCKTLLEARKAQAVFARPFALATQADALEAIQRRLADALEATTDKPTIADCWEAYLASRERPQSGDATLGNYQHYATVFVSWAKAIYPQAVNLEDVTKEQATQFLNHLQDRMSAATVNKYHAFLRLLFKTLLDGHSPFQRLRFLQAEHTAHKPLSEGQIGKVLEVTTGELNLLFHVGVYTALRMGDAALLRWDQVDMVKGVITVTPHKTASRSGRVVTIPIHPQLRAALETRFHKGEYVMPKMAVSYQRARSIVGRYVHNAFAKAGIQTQENGRTVYGFHSLRYSMGQRLVDSGYSLAIIQQVLGHSSQTMTRHYSTITEKVRAQAILSLPSIVSA